MKTCTKCGEHKPLLAFNKAKRPPDKLQYYCKTCQQIARKNHYDANKAKAADYQRKYVQSNVEAVKAQRQEYRKANRQKIAQVKRQWSQTNHHRRLAANAKRHAAKLQATPPWLSPEHHAEIALCYEEAAALRLYTGQQYHVDHIVPLQGKTVCGLHVPWNLQVLLARDNIRKSNNFEG